MIKRTNTKVTLDDLYCTDKAHRDIKNFTNDLTGRERQLLIIMSSDSKLSTRACASISTKVDLTSLIERGYLSDNDESGSQQSSNDEIAFINTSSDMPVVANQNENEPEALLRLVTGNF